MTPPFEAPASHAVELRSLQRQHVIHLRGEIDIAAKPDFEAALEKAIKRGGRLVLDLSETTFMDSTGLNLLVRAHHQSGRLQEALVLRSPSPSVVRLLELTGINHLVTIDDDKAKTRSRSKTKAATSRQRAGTAGSSSRSEIDGDRAGALEKPA